MLAEQERLLHQQYQVKMTKNKRGISGLAWVLIILVLALIGIGIFFFLSGDSSSVINVGTNTGTSSGGSIPQPPALPS